MPSYRYSAMDAKGKERRGLVDAKDEPEAAAKLRADGLFPTTITVTKETAAKTGPKTGKGKQKKAFKSSAIVFGAPKMKRKKLTEFTRQLATLLEAGMPVVRSLRTLEDQATDVLCRFVIAQVAEEVEGGQTLSEAFAGQTKTFDAMYVNMVRAGEASGALESVLSRVAEHMEKAARLRSRVKSALTYPISVLVIAFLITTGLLMFIVPRFETVFDDLVKGEPLPFMTRMVIELGNIVRDHSLYVVIVLGLLAVALKLFRQSRFGAYWIDYILLKTPPFGSLTTKASVARFCSTLGTLMNSGVPILQALKIVRDTAGNQVLAQTVQTVHDAVQEGESIAAPLKATGAFPKMVTGMIEIGEETGALPEMLDRVAKVYEEEVDLAVDSLTSLIEPLMIVFLGVVIGGIVISMFLPLITIIGRFGG